jgi:hypothetical protein
MKPAFLIVPLAFALAVSNWSQPTAAAQMPAQPSSQPSSVPAQPPIGARGDDQENARKARALLDQAIQALGGQAFLTANKGYEVTYKGPHAVEKKDLDDYLRRRRLSLETVLRTWPNDPSVAFFYDGNALAGNLPAEQITLINAQNEAVSLFFDLETHLPIKKTYKWRDPIDKERNIEEELFDNYRLVQGVMTPWGFTRYYNGDMQNQRFVNSVRYNQDLNQAMFDPNSGYDPNKSPGKR